MTIIKWLESALSQEDQELLADFIISLTECYPDDLIIRGPAMSGKTTLSRILKRLADSEEEELLIFSSLSESHRYKLKNGENIICVIDTNEELDNLQKKLYRNIELTLVENIPTAEDADLDELKAWVGDRD
jgi:ABC-type phosphate/phosphonate transport system ATPase subunit